MQSRVQTLIPWAIRSILTATSLILAGLPSLQAQDPPEPGFRSRIVDVVILENKERLFGILAPEENTRLLIRADWLRTNAPKLFVPDFDTCLKNAVNDAPQSSMLLNKLQQEIQSIDVSVEENRHLAQVLDETAQRILQQQMEPPALVILEIPREMVRRRQSQPENIQRLGLLAFLNALPQPELMTRADATQKLQQIPAAQLISDLPKTTDQSDQQLRMVLAAADFRAGRKGTIIQSGSTFVADDGTASAETLLPALLQQSMQQQISELLGEGFSTPAASQFGNTDENRPPSRLDPKAAELAQRNRWNTVELTSFRLRIETDSAEVSRSIYHRRNQNWDLVHHASASATSADLSDEQQEEIRNDPQIQSVLQLFGQLGTNDDQITRAIRLGTVVRVASARSGDKVQDFVSRSLRGEFTSTNANSIPTLTLKQASP